MRRIEHFLPLDPSLARDTRVGHWVLFLVGSALLVPAALVMWFASVVFLSGGGPVHNREEWWLVVTALAGTGTGVLAWAALGLLFFKQADPRFQAVAWSLVLVFTLVASAGSVYWLAIEMSAEGMIRVMLCGVLLGCGLGLLFGLPAWVRSLRSWRDWQRRCREQAKPGSWPAGAAGEAEATHELPVRPDPCGRG